jgi:deferrochelatase/peroxidase EfeB
MNPRDTKKALLADVNLHRHHQAEHDLRRALRPQRALAAGRRDPRGLHFIFISAKRWHTMEFLQQEWINNGNFMNLGAERDPNVGLQEDEATFTIPHEPVRRRIHGIETFNVLRGGEYFLMPSLSALSWLGNLDEQQER